MKFIARTLQKTSPSRLAGGALSLGTLEVGLAFSSPVERMARLLLPGPEEALLLAQALAALGMVLSTSLVLIGLLWFKVTTMARDHESELKRLASVQPAAAPQTVGLVTQQTRRQMLSRGIEKGRDW